MICISNSPQPSSATRKGSFLMTTANQHLSNRAGMFELGLTLLGLGTEGLVQHIGHILEDLGVDVLLLLGVQEIDADGPVTKGEARNTTVGVGTGALSACYEEGSLPALRCARQDVGYGSAYMTFCSVMILTVLLTCRGCQLGSTEPLLHTNSRQASWLLSPPENCLRRRT